MKDDPAIYISDLKKIYKGASDAAVNKLSISVKENEIFGLLGPNGAGKTTTISILTGLLYPTSGSIKIQSIDIKHHLKKIKPLMGVVSQDIALYDKLTAKENLQYFGSLYKISKKELSKTIDDALHQLGLYKNKDVQIKKYSGGMKRRINILAGVLHKPKLLFLDEPTVGVDVQTRNVIREYLKELRNQGTTIIYSSHIMEDVENLCDRIVIIDHGKKILEGEPKQLIASRDECNNLEDVFLELTGRKLRD